MLVFLALLFVVAAVTCAVLGLTWRGESLMAARMAMLRGERPSVNLSGVMRADPVSSRIFAPMANAIGSKMEILLPGKWLEGIDTSLMQAGQPVTRTGFLIGALVTEVTLVGFGLLMTTTGDMAPVKTIGLLIGCVVMGFFMPKVWLSNRVRHRQHEILKSLPDAFDLITVCVEAGLGLDAALARVSEKVEGPFGEELSIMLKEVSLGKLRRDALRELSARAGVPDLITFINAVIQAESMGTSIATVLRVQAEQMRTRRRQRAEQQAHQAPIKMMFPLVLCIFPTLFIVILGPAGIALYQQFASQ